MPLLIGAFVAPVVSGCSSIYRKANDVIFTPHHQTSGIQYERSVKVSEKDVGPALDDPRPGIRTYESKWIRSVVYEGGSHVMKVNRFAEKKAPPGIDWRRVDKDRNNRVGLQELHDYMQTREGKALKAKSE
ncbi:MAG: hypothetical protein QF486_04145 [Candidatus Woesearchaeota archaeon]|nr:hypothetical protein [Candidatus Woesearchaeota archaeon]MDP7181694.1 hypothetical protein [Candidatus Woesearchaeota archaeon]MDP7198783.1 hypothetical protein [Candidatus Woesearchaeota archaeon]MDP7467217.1 hypothetical protein [Candidatus Woesearchaeota archaeon]MDP7647448.1 hypothetical protein [Candidatus Woesearchaeota archaeon]